MKNSKLGEKIIRLEQVNSTNQFAKDLIAHVDHIEEGTTIVTYDQLSGRGRHEKTWVSEKNKNLCISIILFPTLDPSDTFLLSKFVSAGIRDYLDSLNILDVCIKWPNDIYVRDRKIAGILIENSWKKNAIQESIIGIGLNVNQTHFPDMTNNPISMKMIRKSEFNLEEVLIGLLKYLEKRYAALCEGKLREIENAYHEHLYRLNEENAFSVGGEIIRGTIRGVERDGKLKVQVGSEGIRLFDLDQIEFRHGDQPDF